MASPDQHGLDIQVAPADSTVIVTATGDLDFGNSEKLVTSISATALEGAERVVVDVAGITFCDSSGLRALVLLAEQVNVGSRTFSVTGVRPQLQRLIDVAGLGVVLQPAG